MNPCPCGFDGDPDQNCRCTPNQIQRYRQRISGPLLDRIDLTVAMTRIAASDLLDNSKHSESSAPVKTRVIQANNIQLERQGCNNAQLSGTALENFCSLGKAEKFILQQAMENMKLSARALHRILRVARTIADLEQAPDLNNEHIGEALGYRNPELKL